MTRTGSASPDPVVTFRRPTEADYPELALVIDDWWGRRVVGQLFPRLWFRYCAGTSWVATAEGTAGRERIVGFVTGFVGPDDRRVALLQAVGVHPSFRRRGIGRALVERFQEDVERAGASRIEGLSWPGDRTATRFHLALGFVPADEPGVLPLYGTPALADHEFGTEDRVRFVRSR